MANKRPHGDGLIRKRVDGRWEGRITVGYDSRGKPLFRQVFGKTQKEVTEKVHDIIDKFRDVQLTEESRMTLREWLDKWLEDYVQYQVKDSTYEGYKMYVELYVNPRIGNSPIGAITTADIQVMYNNLKKYGRVNEHSTKGSTLADSSIRRIHAILHQALDKAVEERLIVENPTNGTTVPKCNYAPKQILTEEQLARFYEELKKDPWWYDFFHTELTTGLRRGEICGLQWSDFNEKTGRLQVRRSVTSRRGQPVRVGTTKTNAGTRSILLPRSTAELLRERKANSYSQWIFHNPVRPEMPMTPSTPYHKLKKILKDAELPSIRFHDLRHTFATHALAKGVDPKTLSGILGHTNASFTLDTYTHVTGDMQKKASEIVGGFLDEFTMGGLK